MAFAGIFALVGTTQRSLAKASPPAPNQDVKIILGTTLGTVLLFLLSEAGDGAASFAVGLAGITLISSVLINGTGVFNAINKATPLTKPVAPVTANKTKVG